MLNHWEIGLEASGQLIFLRFVWPSFLDKFYFFSQEFTTTYFCFTDFLIQVQRAVPVMAALNTLIGWVVWLLKCWASYAKP